MKERYNFKEVMFFDNIFTIDKNWLKELMNIYTKEIKVPFRCHGHVSFFDYEIGELLKEGGCYTIDFGIQTFNENVRKNYLNRHEKHSQIVKTFEVCDQLKLKYDIDLIIGLPGSTVSDYELPAYLLKDNISLNRLKPHLLTYFPKLPIIDKAIAHGELTKEDCKNIDSGITNNYFHQSFSCSNKRIRLENNFIKFYKIYAILPSWLRIFIVKRKLYRIFQYLPNALIIFIQYLNGAKNKDYRFGIYMNHYWYQFRKKFLSATNKQHAIKKNT